MSAKEKTFLFALSLISSDPEKAKNHLEDKRLTSAEKIVLRSYFLLRNNKMEEVIKELNGLTGKMSEVVESQRQLLLGLAHNNLCDYKTH